MSQSQSDTTRAPFTTRQRVNFNAQCAAWSGDTGQRCELCESHPLPHRYATRRDDSLIPATDEAAHYRTSGLPADETAWEEAA